MDGIGPTDTNHHPNFVTKISLLVRKARMMALSGGKNFDHLYVRLAVLS